MNNNGTEKKPETKFCRLCGKHRPLDEIMPIMLTQIDQKNGIVYQGCHACSVVIHNAQAIIEETIRRIIDEQPKIIQPIVVPLKPRKC